MPYHIHEDRPTPKEVYNWIIYALTFAACSGSVIYGYDNAFVGGTLALPSFASEFGLNDNPSRKDAVSSNIVSFYQVGAFFGTLGCFPISERFGRKIAMTIGGLVFCIGAVMMTVGDRGIGVLYAGRAIGGIGVGMNSLSIPIYLAEVSPPAIRGRLVGLYDAILQIGGLLGFWINYAVDQNMAPTTAQWRVPMAVQLIPGGLFFICSIFLIESPRWLRRMSRNEEALATLCKIRKLSPNDMYTEEELQMIDDQISRETLAGSGSAVNYFELWKHTLQRGVRNRLSIAVIAFLFQNLYGVNALNYYSPVIFKSIGIRGTSTGLLATGIYGVVKMVVTFIWVLFVVDQSGRKPALAIGSVGGAICMYWVGIYVAVGKPEEKVDTSGPDGGGISAIFAIYLFITLYCLSYSGTPWVIASEIFPIKVRTFCVSLTSASQWAFNVMISRSTPYMLTSIGYGTYIFFGTWCVLSFFWIIFFLPETKGLPLEQIDKLFGGRLADEAERLSERQNLERDNMEKKSSA